MSDPKIRKFFSVPEGRKRTVKRSPGAELRTLKPNSPTSVNR
ncbi:hypothetical protein [Laspinema sp. D2d]|nr:hypothetical protein [Laspinema sp. D2d]